MYKVTCRLLAAEPLPLLLLTSVHFAVCECVSSASLSEDSRQKRQTSLGLLTLMHHIKASSWLRALTKPAVRVKCCIFGQFFRTKYRKGAPNPEVESSSPLQKESRHGLFRSLATSSGIDWNEGPF